VQYSGNMGLWHDIDTIVRAADRLAGDDQVHFLMIGGGIRSGRAKRLAAELGLSNMTWIPFRAREALSDSLACCHVALISQRAGLVGSMVPCKLYGILESGRAVIAIVPPGSEVAQVVAEEACGRVVAPEDVEGIVSAIRDLQQDPRALRVMGLNGLDAARNRYSLAAAVARYRSVWK